MVDDWHDVAIAKLGEILDNSKALLVYMDACVKCGACTDKCHYFLGAGDPKNMPVARQDLLRKVYRRHFTFAGKWLPWLVGAEDLTAEVLDDWYTYFHQCSQCRRCAVFCPYGIDTAEFSMAAREIMDSVGKGQKYCNEIIGKVHEVGNNLGLNPRALAATLADLEEDIEEDCGVAVRLPLDQAGAEVLLVTPSADFFAEPHMAVFRGEGGEIERRACKPCEVFSVHDGVLTAEEWPPLLEDSRQPHDREMSLERLAGVWTGKITDDYADAAITGTLAIALHQLGRASDPATAQAKATEMWQARDRGRLAA